MDVDGWGERLFEPFRQLIDAIIPLLPRFVGAVLLFLFGLVLAFLLRSWIGRLIGGFQLLIRKKFQGGAVAPPVDRAAPGLAGRIVFWSVVVFFFAASLQVLGQQVVSDWPKAVAKYLPHFVAAAMVVLAGYLIGNLAEAAVSRIAAAARVVQGEVLGRLAKYITILLFVLIALDQVGLHISLLIVIAAIVSGMFAGGLALAFGLGAKPAVTNLLASHYLAKTYKTGQRIRMEGLEGRILNVGLTSVVLETPEGEMILPASYFAERPCVILKEG